MEGKSPEEVAALAVEGLQELGIQVNVQDSTPGIPSELNGATLEVGQQEGGGRCACPCRGLCASNSGCWSQETAPAEPSSSIAEV